MHVHSLIGLSVGGVCGKADTTEFQEFSFLLAPGSLCWGCQAMLTSDDAEAKKCGLLRSVPYHTSVGRALALWQ